MRSLSISPISLSLSPVWTLFGFSTHRSQHIYATHYKHNRKYYAVKTDSYVV